MEKKALILGGGSILGGFEAGEICAVLENGYSPSIVAGISVGSCNGAYIVNAKANNQWHEIGKMLWNFWVKNIRAPNDVVKKRKVLSLGWSIYRKKFNGLTDTAPIDTLIEKMIDMDNIRNSGVDFSVGTVNINDANIMYAQPHSPNFKEYVKASKAIPIVMPCVGIGFQTFVDGGLVDSAPIGEAIKKGATEIIVCTPHPEKLGGAEINTGDILELTDRVVSIMLNNTLNNDIKLAQLINQLCPADGSAKPDEPYKGKRRIPITVIRPDNLISISLSKFTKDDVRMMLETGYATAKNILN